MEVPTEIPEMINEIVVAWWQIHNRLEKSWNKLVIPLEFPVAPGWRKFSTQKKIFSWFIRWINRQIFFFLWRSEVAITQVLQWKSHIILFWAAKEFCMTVVGLTSSERFFQWKIRTIGTKWQRPPTGLLAARVGCYLHFPTANRVNYCCSGY